MRNRKEVRETTMSDGIQPGDAERGSATRRLNRLEFLRLAGAGVGITMIPASLAACGGSTEGGSGTVEWTSWKTKAEAQEFIDAFKESHPKIKIAYAYQTYADYIQDLKLDMASRRGADVIGLQAGSMIAEYNEFIEDLTPYAKETWGSDWQSRFYNVGLEQLIVDGKLTTLPAPNNGAGYVWYNKTIFDRYDLQPPETYDEWVQVSGKLKSKGVTPFVQGAKDDWVNFDMYIALANELAPGKIYDAEAGNVSWTDPDLTEAMTIWGEMFQNGIMQDGALGILQYPDAHDTWTKGDAAMILFGTWNNDHMVKPALKEYQSSLGFKEEWEFLPIRFPDVNGDGQGGRLFGGPDVALALNKDSQAKEAAWQLISFMMSERAQEIYAEDLDIPSIKGVSLANYSDDLVYPDTQKPALEQELEDFENSIGRREFLYADLETAIGDALQNVASGQATPKQAMASIEKESQNIER
jgi:raffinose/stachyose/melibiose transport system substrate-binding protein